MDNGWCGGTGTGIPGGGSTGSSTKGDRGGRTSGSGIASKEIQPPPQSPTVGLTAPHLSNNCPEEYNLTQCFYSGGFYMPNGLDNDIIFDSENFQEFDDLLLALFFDIKSREPIGGYDFANRSVADTPLWDGYGHITGDVCFQDGCYARSEVNYVYQGMWSASSGQTLAEGYVGTIAWKTCGFLTICSRGSGAIYSPIPSKGTFHWLTVGYVAYHSFNRVIQP